MFTAVFLAFVLIITAIVALANLASFTSDYGDKVRLPRRRRLERTLAAKKKALLFFVPTPTTPHSPADPSKTRIHSPRQEWVILEDEATTKTDAGESAIALADRYVTGSASLDAPSRAKGGR